MPYKYIGRTIDFKGKTLWEIVGNLKNFGVGRIVARNMFERYPEPSYMKILKVEALPCPEKQSADDMRKVRVWVEKTFRGMTGKKSILIESASYKADYKLIPKNEESTYCQAKEEEEAKILPRYVELPPLLKELITSENKAKGEALDANTRIELVYNKRSTCDKYRIAQDGETPNVEFTMGIGKPLSPRLFKGITL